MKAFQAVAGRCIVDAQAQLQSTLLDRCCMRSRKRRGVKGETGRQDDA